MRMPSVSEVAQEALIVLAGALVAALIVRNVPQLRQWLKDSWDGGCNCR